ncbi:phenylacetate--CoA ligase family protein [Priestia aryabhattai]|uniref:phenylacetate--CoA ligase family protein n=1 Tax=Priestia aryabhattai TaxID=412384 RepID=UPI001CBD230E|nr:hypothetical protein [Priestia aryabhattai]
MKKFLKVLEPPLRYAYYSIPDYLRYGKLFREKYNYLEKSQYYSEEKNKQKQLKMLQDLIKHSYETVPYYRKLFNELQLKPKDIKSLEDIKKIPYLTKEIIRDNYNELLSNQYSKDCLRTVRTGGSTGEPLSFYVEDYKDRAIEWAYVSHLWSRVGYNVRKVNKRVILMGEQINSGLFHYKNRDLIMSSFKLTEHNIPEYLKEIEKYNPDFIHCYPSSIFIIAKFIIENRYTINLKNLKAILCVSENLSEMQREAIYEAFNKRVYSFYGHSEHACIAGECEKSELYHIEPFYGYTELINDGKEVKQEGELGEIVSTSFLNYAMPFIRYRTGDIAINTNKKCDCGREYKIIKKIEGREQEFIVTKSGNKVMLTGSYKILHGLNNKIFAGQFYQDTEGILILKIVPRNIYQAEDADYIYKEFREKFGNEIKLKVEKVASIERTNSGKFKFLIQKLQVK